MSCLVELTAPAHRFDEAEALLVEHAGFEFGEIALMRAGCTEGYVPARSDVAGPWNPGPLAQRLAKTRGDHAETLQRFHEVFYEAGCTWTTTKFLGLSIQKAPTDLWMYQEVLAAMRPKTVITTEHDSLGLIGYFAVLLAAIHGSLTGWHVLSENVTAADVAGPALVSIGGDYLEDAVYGHLVNLGPLADYMVVERTNVAWGDIPALKGDGGARAAVARYLSEHPGEWEQDQSSERFLVTLNPGGWLKRVGRPA